jgi:hypothetical protein
MTQSNQTNAEHPEIAEVDWIDDCFRLEQKKWGTWESFDMNGKGIVTALTREACLSGTRFHLKGLQDGWQDYESKTFDGTVGGKL